MRKTETDLEFATESVLALFPSDRSEKAYAGAMLLARVFLAWLPESPPLVDTDGEDEADGGI